MTPRACCLVEEASDENQGAACFRRPPVLPDSFTLSSSSVVLPGGERDGIKSNKNKWTYWKSVASIGAQVAGALEYAHKQGIQHRRYQAVQPSPGHAGNSLGCRLRAGQGRRSAEPDEFRRYPGHTPLHATGGV